VVNRYIVTHGEDRDLVLYWYQSRGRVVASEYKAKFWVVADAMRYNRTDTAIVRVIVPIDKDTRDSDAAQRTAVDVVKTFYGRDPPDSAAIGFVPRKKVDNRRGHGTRAQPVRLGLARRIPRAR